MNLKNVLISVIVCLMIISCRKDSPKEPQITKSQSLELRMAGTGSAVGAGKLLLSSEFKKISSQKGVIAGDSSIDSSNDFRLIDSTATALSSRLFMESDPQIIISRLNECFFGQMKINVDNSKESLSDILPDKVYQSKQGNVIGAAMLMLLLGEKADIPIFCVKVRSHYFLRFDNGKVQQNIELLKQGAANTDSWYTTNYELSGIGSDTIKKLTSAEAAGVLRYAVGNAAAISGNKEMAVENFAYGLANYKDFRECQAQMDLIIDNAPDVEKMLSILMQLRISCQDLYSLDRCLAVLYLRQKNFKSAADNFLRALERSPDDFVLTRGAGIAYLNLHNFDSAKVYLSKAGTARPSDSLVNALIKECP